MALSPEDKAQLQKIISEIDTYENGRKMFQLFTNLRKTGNEKDVSYKNPKPAPEPESKNPVVRMAKKTKQKFKDFWQTGKF